jgi:hypothetical protein
MKSRRFCVAGCALSLSVEFYMLLFNGAEWSGRVHGVASVDGLGRHVGHSFKCWIGLIRVNEITWIQSQSELCSTMYVYIHNAIPEILPSIMH